VAKRKGQEMNPPPVGRIPKVSAEDERKCGRELTRSAFRQYPDEEEAKRELRRVLQVIGLKESDDVADSA